VEEIADKITYLELIADGIFTSEFTAALFLPHTNIHNFPSVKSLLARQGKGELPKPGAGYFNISRIEAAMSKTIAIAGKGGTGKTTIAALLIELLTEKGAVLAIDGDPSANLHMALGLTLEETVGGVREGMLDRKAVERMGIPRPNYMELRIQEALVESPRVDLLAMGRPEGPGCYCAANNWLRTSIDRLADNYDYVVIDNEAGMEHISRQTTRDVDILLLTSDPTIRGVSAAVRMKDLIGELRTHVERIALVVNRVGDGLPSEIERAITDANLELIGVLPEDPDMMKLEVMGTPLTKLPPESPLRKGVSEIAKRLGLR